MRRSPWLDERAELLVQYLGERHGLTLSIEIAREDISNHLDFVAERMRIRRQSAKSYVTEDSVRGLADHIANVVATHNDAIAAGEVCSLDVKRAQRPRGPLV